MVCNAVKCLLNVDRDSKMKNVAITKLVRKLNLCN